MLGSPITARGKGLRPLLGPLCWVGGRGLGADLPFAFSLQPAAVQKRLLLQNLTKEIAQVRAQQEHPTQLLEYQKATNEVILLAAAERMDHLLSDADHFFHVKDKTPWDARRPLRTSSRIRTSMDTLAKPPLWSGDPCKDPHKTCGGCSTSTVSHLEARRQTNNQTYIHTYLHTYIHTRVHTRMHAYIHTYIHTHVHTYLRTYIPTYLHTYIRTYLHTYIHTFIHTFIHSFVHSFIHAFIHSLTHSYIHTYIHTYTHTCSCSSSFVLA